MVRIGFFRDLKNFFCFFGVLLFLLLFSSAILGFGGASLYFTGYLLLLPAYGLGGLWCLKRIAVKRFQRLNQLFYEDCNITAYIAWCQKLDKDIKRPEKFIVQQTSAYIYSTLYDIAVVNLWLANGYRSVGNADEAARALETMGRALSQMQHSDKPLLLQYHEMRFFLALCMGNCEEAELLLQDMNILAKPNPSLVQGFAFHRALLALEKGCPDDAIALFPELLSKAATHYERVCLHWHLARALLMAGKADEAREHLLFALRNGGDTCYAQEAHALLKFSALTEG